MSLQEIQTSLQAVGETVQAGQGQLMRALEFLETSRETLQGAADHSAVAEHAQAVALFQEAEADLLALHNHIAQFHPAVTSYLGSLGMKAPEPEPQAPPQESKPGPAAPAPPSVPGQPKTPPQKPEEGVEPEQADSDTKPETEPEQTKPTAPDESAPPAHPSLPKSVTVLDDHPIHEDKPVSRVGFHDGVIVVNNDASASGEGETLNNNEAKALALGSVGLNTAQTGEVLYKSGDSVHDYREGVYEKMGGELAGTDKQGNSNMPRAVVTAFNSGVLAVEKPISNPVALDETDKQVLTRLGRGETYEQIASNLGITAREVRNDISARVEQVGAVSRTGLLTYGIASQQVDPKNIVLPLPNHLTVIESQEATGGRGSNTQLLKATFQGGVISVNPETKTSYEFNKGAVVQSNNGGLSTAQNNVLLLSGLGLGGPSIAEASSASQASISMQRHKISNKLAGQGLTAPQLTVEALRNGNLQVNQYINIADAVPLDRVALKVVSDAAQGKKVATTASDLGMSEYELERHLNKTVYANVPADKMHAKISSIVTYSILSQQYDPFTGKTISSY